MANLARSSRDTLMGDDDRIDYPTVYLTAEQVDALGLWAFDVGETTKMQATIRIAEKCQDSGEDRRVTIELIDGDVKKKEGIDANRMFPTTVAAMPARITK
jgi:hypothetical protein